MRRINRRKSPERVQKNRIGKHFNALLQKPSAIRRSENPVTLLDLYQLIDDSKDFLYLRTFACDVIEVRITGGEVSEIRTPTRLSGIRTYAVDYHYAHIQSNPRNWARDRPIRLLNNGVLEISDGPHLKSTTSFLEGIMRAEQAKHLRGHIAALVVTSDPKDEDAIVSQLFFRQKRYVSRGVWQEYWTEYKDYTKNTGLSHKDAQTLLEELSTDSCIHKFSIFATTGWKKILEVIERCEFCDEERTRKPTEREQKKHAREKRNYADSTLSTGKFPNALKG